MSRPNTLTAARQADASVGLSGTAVAAMLVARTIGFAAFQALAALGYSLAGAADPWQRSIAWWPYTATATSLVTLTALVLLLRREGSSYRALLRVDRATWRRDLLVVLGLAVLSAALAVGPNLGLARLLFGDAAVAVELFLQPLPLWAAAGALVLFPVTIAASELPVYFGYVQPRLEVLTGRAWAAVALAAGALALQHATLPLVFDWRFVAWRALMFVPFAVLVAVVLRWRPRLMPYLLVVHLLADLSVAAQVLSAASPST